VGRPLKPIDAEMVRKLAKIGCTQRDIAEFFDVSQSVISERFRSDFQLARIPIGEKRANKSPHLD
jgi:predicted transcriptional regulator